MALVVLVSLREKIFLEHSQLCRQESSSVREANAGERPSPKPAVYGIAVAEHVRLLLVCDSEKGGLVERARDECGRQGRSGTRRLPLTSTSRRLCRPRHLQNISSLSRPLLTPRSAARVMCREQMLTTKHRITRPPGVRGGGNAGACTRPPYGS